MTTDPAMPAPPLPDPTPVLDLLEAFRRSRVMFSAAALGVFDQLAQGPVSLTQLASALGADPDALQRLLDGCVCLELVTREGGHYANSPVAATYLTSTSPHRLTGYVGYSGAVLWRLWAHLEEAVREGTHRWEQAFGHTGSIFEHLYRSPESRREFLLGMHGQGLLSSPHVVAAFDLSRFRRLVDLGGATGHLAVAACRRYPQLRATVFDLPAVLPLARELIAATEVLERIELVEGDFFTDPLPEADLFSLGKILHDWTEDKIHRLLERIHARLPAGGGLLIAEKLLNDDRPGPSLAVFQSLNMLVCTEGKERTLGEYEVLLRTAGFAQVEGWRTASSLDAVLAVKGER